jgi:DNA-3-methyladenine glycosylase
VSKAAHKPRTSQISGAYSFSPTRRKRIESGSASIIDRQGVSALGIGTLGQKPSPPKPTGVKANQSARRSGSVPGSLIPRTFFEMTPEHVAPRLLGKILIHRTQTGVLAGRIVEVEAYLGPHHSTPDAAAHSHRGPTPRTQVLFGPAGRAYVYAIYGRYYCMNISCELEGQAGSVLLRALEPIAGAREMARNRGLSPDAQPCELTGGPSRLCLALGLTRPVHNGLDLLDPDSALQARDDGYQVRQVMITPRIGLNPTNPALRLPLRFVLPGNACVSGPKSFTGKCIFLD